MRCRERDRRLIQRDPCHGYPSRAARLLLPGSGSSSATARWARCARRGSGADRRCRAEPVRPGLVETIHDSYVSAGADIIQADTSGANRLWLGDHGCPDKVDGVQQVQGPATAPRPLRVRTAPCSSPARWRPGARVQRRRVGSAERIEVLRSRSWPSWLPRRRGARRGPTDPGDVRLPGRAWSRRYRCRVGDRRAADRAGLVRRRRAHARRRDAARGRVPCSARSRCRHRHEAARSGHGDAPRRHRYLVRYSAVPAAPADTRQPRRVGPRSFKFSIDGGYFARYLGRFADAGITLVGGCCGATPTHIRAATEAVRARAADGAASTATRVSARNGGRAPPRSTAPGRWPSSWPRAASCVGRAADPARRS